MSLIESEEFIIIKEVINVYSELYLKQSPLLTENNEKKIYTLEQLENFDFYSQSTGIKYHLEGLFYLENINKNKKGDYSRKEFYSRIIADKLRGFSVAELEDSKNIIVSELMKTVFITSEKQANMYNNFFKKIVTDLFDFSIKKQKINEELIAKKELRRAKKIFNQ